MQVISDVESKFDIFTLFNFEKIIVKDFAHIA